MPAPLHRMRKDEILRLSKTKCKAHSHTYIDHYSCYLKENPTETERIAFMDIEASNLDADFGICLSWAIKDSTSNKIYSDILTLADIKKGHEDKRLIQSFLKCLSGFDKVVGYYSTDFDIPFMRARALIVGVEFPVFGTMKHKDIYYTIKSKFKLSSKRLENACRQLLGRTQKTRIDAIHWRNATRGDKNALAYILDHNKKDVLDLEALYNKVIDFSRVDAKSI